MKIQYLIKGKFINQFLLLDYLKNYMVVPFPGYRVTELPVTNGLIRFEGKTQDGFLINSAISVYISTKNE